MTSPTEILNLSWNTFLRQIQRMTKRNSQGAEALFLLHQLYELLKTALHFQYVLTSWKHAVNFTIPKAKLGSQVPEQPTPFPAPKEYCTLRVNCIRTV